jgi:hypothetical protein
MAHCASWGSRSRSGRSPGSCGIDGGRHPRPDGPSSRITWRLVSMDFFTVPTLTGRVLFVLVRADDTVGDQDVLDPLPLVERSDRARSRSDPSMAP